MNSRVHCILILLLKLVHCFDIDDPPVSSTNGGFFFNNGQYGRSNNQTDDIVSTIYSTVASVSKDLSTSGFNNTYSPPGILNREEDEPTKCRGTKDDEEFTIRPNQRVCDYLVNRNHSGICSLDLSLVDWKGDCRESWLEAGGKLECGTLTGTRRLTFDRSAITLRMRSSDGILIVKQIPCSTQVNPPLIFAENPSVPYQLKPEHQQYPAPYIPPNLRPTTVSPESDLQTFPVSSYTPSTDLGSHALSHPNSIDNEVSYDKIDSTVQIPNTKYPVLISQQNNKGQTISTFYRPNYPQTMYPGMRYGPPECDRNAGVVISSTGYPNISPPSECILIQYSSVRLCSPLIYFDYFEFGSPYGSSCQDTRLEIGGFPFCGCLSGMTWQVPNNIFSSDGSLRLRYKGQGRFLITVYFNTCQPGYNPYPPNQRQPWRCEQYPSPQPYPVNPYPPIQPQPPRPTPPFPRPFPQPEPYPYPPRQPRPQPPFTYPPQPQPRPQPPVIYPPSYPYPPPLPIPQPQPQPYPEPIPEPFPPCQIIRVPEGSINCAPIQPKFYCYRFEPPKGYCQTVIRLDEISMASDQNCNKEYLSTGLRNPRICQKDIPMYVDRGGYLQGKLMPGSSMKASFQGIPCSCNVDYRQADFTLRGTPSQDACRYTIHRANEGVCSLEMTFENIDLQCGTESLIIDGKSYCGFRANEKLEVPFVEPSMSVQYQRNRQPLKPGSFSINVSQKSRCLQTFSSATGRDIKYNREDCTLPLTGVYGNIEFPGSSSNPAQYPACTYLFQPRQGYCYVRLDFDDVDIANTLDCYRYYIEINGIKYCGNTLNTSTKVLELDEERGSSVSYNVDRSSRWRFTYSLLPCRQEISARAQTSSYSTNYYTRNAS